MNQGLLMWFSLHLLTSAGQMLGSGDLGARPVLPTIYSLICRPSHTVVGRVWQRGYTTCLGYASGLETSAENPLATALGIIVEWGVSGLPSWLLKLLLSIAMFA